MDMTQNDDELLTPKEAAALLLVAVSTLVRWRRETRKTGKLCGPAWVTVGYRTVSYRRGAVQDYIRSREQRADG